MLEILSLLGSYAMALTVFGTIGNMITIFVSVKSQKTNSTFVLFRYLAVNNAFSLYFWNLSHFTAVLNFNLQDFSLFVCKFGSWIQLSSLQSSAWILVLISVDRFLIFKIRNWKSKYFTKRRAIFAGFILMLLIYLINGHVLITHGIEFDSNGTTVVRCFGTDWMQTWNMVHSYMYSFIPFTVLAIINILLIWELQQLKNSIKGGNSRVKKNQMKITFSVILMTILFIAFTSASAVCSQYFEELILSRTGTIILFASDNLTFSYHGLNIIILCENKLFFIKLKEAFGLLKGTSLENATPTARN